MARLSGGRLPGDIVRPSHTYDRTSRAFDGGWTVVERMRRGQEVVVHGDGTSLWTLTHHVDFAKAFVGLLGHPQAIGDSFHITSDEVLTWNQIYEPSAPRPGRSRASCTSPPMRSSPRTSTGAARCSATRRTR